MARSHQPVPALVPLALARPRAEVTAKLRTRIDRGKELQARSIQSHKDREVYKIDAGKWRDYNLDLLLQLYTNESLAREYRRVALPSRAADNEADEFSILEETVDRQITKLKSLVERLELYPDAVPAVSASGKAVGSEDRSKIFVVHGHDEGAREAVARFIQTLGLQPIILNEIANEGGTVIEKVEAHGAVGFAVVLLTPDDEGCVKGGTPSPRARQNVILELGYFIGRLGRKQVCALKRGELEIPSDFGGVVYETFDTSGGWKQKLGRELEASGYEINWNTVMRS